MDPRPAFVPDVERFTAGPAWVTEWQYDRVRTPVADRADLMVWLDLPHWIVMRQVLGRTLRRWHGREELWNGNREPRLHRVVVDREHVVRWAWSSYSEIRAHVRTVAAARPELPVVRLRSPGEGDAWLGGPLAAAGPGADTDRSSGDAPHARPRP